jgi:putative ATP-binding cassette transporter
MYSIQLGANQIQASGTISYRGLFLFSCSLIAYYLTQLFTIKISSGAAYSAIEDLELRIVNKLRRLDYENFKKISSTDIYAVLGGDKNAVVNAARFVVITLSAIITVTITLLYMALVSITTVLIILAEYVFMLYVFKVQIAKLEKRNQADFLTLSDFNASLSDVIDGFAELKMNNRRSEDFYQRRVKKTNDVKTESLKETESQWVRLLVIQQANTLFPLGLIVFIAPAVTDMDIIQIAQLVVTTLVVVGPAGQVGNFIGMADMANNTLSRMFTIEKQLDGVIEAGVDGDLSAVQVTPDFSSIKIEALMYHYPLRENRGGAFTLTVKDFYVNKGEMVIIKGGNGSGKSTFMHVIAGLFPPSEGEILLNGSPISSMPGADYRSLFSIVFADFHLFDDFYGLDVTKADFDYWTKRLRLEEKFKNHKMAKDGVFSGANLPVSALSSGQKKRAALLMAILENRPILLFDEVAADFDPEFRTLYYREILPDLKAAGRTLLIVSHDDRFFDAADRVVEFREGTNLLGRY